MRNPFKIFGLILICFWSCINPDKKPGSVTDQKVAILLNSGHNKWLEENYGLKKWTPTDSDLKIVQEVLDEAIENKEFDFLKKPPKQSVEKYYRQYIPYINDKGERIIEINAFCEILEKPPSPGSNEWTKMDWKNEYIIVDDGGDCYWQITINLNTKKYKDLMVNGDA